MTEQERAMRMAIDTIRDLRRENEILQAQVDVMELFGLAMRTSPAYRTQGMGEDAAWLLQQELEKMERAQAEQTLAASA